MKDLNLRANSIGDEGTIALAEALKVSFVCFRECSAFFWLPNPPFLTFLTFLCVKSGLFCVEIPGPSIDDHLFGGAAL